MGAYESPGVLASTTSPGRRWLAASPSEREQQVFSLVAQARDAAIKAVQEAFAAGRPLAGWQADDAARDVIREAGFAEYFTHRTGHSISYETHGNGANLDNLETHDDRLLLALHLLLCRAGNLSARIRRAQRSQYVDGAGPGRRHRPHTNRTGAHLTIPNRKLTCGLDRTGWLRAHAFMHSVRRPSLECKRHPPLLSFRAQPRDLQFT